MFGDINEKPQSKKSVQTAKCSEFSVFLIFLFSGPQVEKFREQLKDAAQKVHTLKPVPGKANGVLVLNQPIQIEAYVGFMSFLGNENKLGYCMARGNLGF